MRTHDEIERLTAAVRPLLSQADSLVDAAGEDRILAQIVASSRAPARLGTMARLRPALLVAGAAIVVAAVAVGVLGHSSSPAEQTGGHKRVALTGAKIEMAGYHFKTPTGFTASTSSCTSSATGRFSAAAAADGGCIEAFVMLNTGRYRIADGAEPIEFGDWHGYVVSANDSITLYVALPQEGEYSPYLMLVGKGLTSDQLIAIAQSGLPANPGPGITTTCTQNCG